MNPQLVLLLTALLIATGTDLARHKIYNWTTYPGIAACLASAGWNHGTEGLLEAALGLLACGGVMLVSYLCLDIGGGDVKLAALIGAGLGWANGLYALLWTFTIAGIIAASIVIWRLGAAKLLMSMIRKLLRRQGDADGSALQAEMRRPLFLAPAALAAVLIVAWPHRHSADRSNSDRRPIQVGHAAI